MVRKHLEVSTNLNHHDNYFIVVVSTLQDMGIYSTVTFQSSRFSQALKVYLIEYSRFNNSVIDYSRV